MKISDEDMKRACAAYDASYFAKAKADWAGVENVIVFWTARLLGEMARAADEQNIRCYSESPDSGRIEPDTQADLSEWIMSFEDGHNG